MKRTRLLFTVAFLILAISSYGQKVKTGKVVRIVELEISLEDNMTFEQFEKFFLEEYIPAGNRNFPRLKFSLLKGDRGIRTGKYTVLVFFDSVEERNRWFPEKGKSSEETKQAFDNMRAIQDKMMKMASNITFTEYEVL
jgi:hypothetical protein